MTGNENVCIQDYYLMAVSYLFVHARLCVCVRACMHACLYVVKGRGRRWGLGGVELCVGNIT